MRVAIVGATGLVGQKMLEVMQERDFRLTELMLVASEKSCGKTINYKGNSHTIISLSELLENPPQLAIFSAGSDISEKWASKLAEKGCKVIDNSSFWRMNPNCKLIVPEINGDQLIKEDFIIANPNCSTIQLVMALAPLHKKYGIKRVIVSTYQSITGTGMKAIKQLENEVNNIEGEMAYPYQIHQNAIPQCDIFLENDYTKEEMKLCNETKKILDDNINVSATAVRIPVVAGHSESVNITFENEIDIAEIKNILSETNGITLQDNVSEQVYPMPIFSQGKDDVFVGRIREDYTFPNTINMWIVSDNLRKGAATNTIQIAEYLLKNNLI